MVPLRHHRCNVPGLLALLAAAFSLLLAGSASAQILDQISPDAMLVVKVHDLAKVSAKVAALCQQFGVVQMQPDMADPLGKLQNTTNVKAGVDTAGDAAFIFMDVNGPEPVGYFLIPVTDYAAFLTNFKDVKKDGDIDVVHPNVPDAPQKDVYAAHWGTYGVLAEDKKILAKPPTGLKLSPATLREWNSKDIVLVANMKVLGPKALEELAKNKQQIFDSFDKASAGNAQVAPKYVPVLKECLKQGISLVEEFLKNSTGAALSVNLTNDGIATTCMGDFEPNSSFGTFIKQIKTTDAPLLAGLPDAKYIFYGGAVMDGTALFKSVENGLAPILAELAKTGDDQKPITDLLALAKKSMGAQKAATVGMLAPSGALGASSLIQQVGVVEGDANTILSCQQDVSQAMAQIQKLMQASGATPVTSSMAFKADAKTVDGISFNEISTKIEVDPKAPEAAQVAQMMAMVYGPNGQQILTGKLDDNHALFANGVDDAMISALIKAAKAHEDVLGKLAEVADVSKNLPATRAFVVYFALDNFLLTVKNYAGQMGMAVPFNLPPNLPPIGTALSTDGSAVKFDTYVPTKLVSSVVAAAMQAFMQFQGGARPGGPGGL